MWFSCRELFIIAIPSSSYDWNTVGKDIKSWGIHPAILFQEHPPECIFIVITTFSAWLASYVFFLSRYLLFVAELFTISSVCFWCCSSMQVTLLHCYLLQQLLSWCSVFLTHRKPLHKLWHQWASWRCLDTGVTIVYYLNVPFFVDEKSRYCHKKYLFYYQFHINKSKKWGYGESNSLRWASVLSLKIPKGENKKLTFSL